MPAAPGAPAPAPAQGTAGKGAERPPPLDRGGSRAEVAPPEAPVSISQRDGANLRPTHAGGGGGGGVPRPARQGPSAPAPSTPRPPPAYRPGAPQARPCPPARAWPPPPGPTPRRCRLGASGSATALTQLVLGGGGGGRSHVEPGRERRRGRKGEGAGGRAARGSRGSRCGRGRELASGGHSARAARRPPGPLAAATAACVLRAASVALAAPRELATRALPQPRASAEPPVRPSFPCAPAALRLRAVLARLTPVLYLERAEPSSQRPPRRAPRAPARPPSLARSLAARPAHLPPPAPRALPARTRHAAVCAGGPA